MNATEELLAHNPVFTGLDPGLISTLAAHASERHLAPDEVLFRTGEAAGAFYLIRSGRIGLDLASAGADPVTVDSYGPGSLVGLSWLIPPYTWYLDARAVEPTTVVVLDAALVRAQCDADPALGYVVVQRVAQAMYQRMQSARVRLLDIYGPPGAH